jgi:hypothetical protein
MRNRLTELEIESLESISQEYVTQIRKCCNVLEYERQPIRVMNLI